MLLFWVVITPMELCTAFLSGSCGKNHACSVSCFSVNFIQFYMADIGTQRCAACPMLGYPLVGGTRQRRFAGNSFEPCKPPENAQTLTSGVYYPGALPGRGVGPVLSLGNISI